ncbi:MAG: ATP-grasp fold amidoligase family protein [Pseudomonadota bacterium]
MAQKPWRHAADALETIFKTNLHGTHLPVPAGFHRGVEVLGDGLGEALTRSVRRYGRSHGRLPDLIAPKTFTEKQVLFKFFGLVPQQSPSDKLRSPGFLPQGLQDRARLPKRVWISDKPALPADDALPPGDYYLKSNHGSGTNMPITFPVPPDARAALEKKTAHWLTKPHTETLSLWWYETMPRNIYLEEDLRNPDGDAPDWKFFVCNGRVSLFQVDVDRRGNHRQMIHGRDGTYVPQELYYQTGAPIPMPDCLPTMVEIAEGIGQNFDFIRVDLFLLRGAPYLGEIALVPNGARTKIRSPELDDRLGAAWTPPWLGEVGDDWRHGHYGGVQYDPTFGAVE